MTNPTPEMSDETFRSLVSDLQLNGAQYVPMRCRECEEFRVGIRLYENEMRRFWGINAHDYVKCVAQRADIYKNLGIHINRQHTPNMPEDYL